MNWRKVPLLILLPILASAADDLAAGRRYLLSPPPSAPAVEAGGCTDEGDPSQLTDGRRGRAEPAAASTVGWTHTLSARAVLDLAAVCRVSAVRAHVGAPAPGVEVATSVDGSVFGGAVSATGDGGWVEVPIEPPRLAQFVRISLIASRLDGPAIAVDEIEVEGRRLGPGRPVSPQALAAAAVETLPLRPRSPGTELARDGQAQVIIATPNDEAYAPVAQKLQSGLASLLSGKPQIVRDATVPAVTQHVLALGHARNNTIIRYLYARGLAWCDGRYPEPGGHIVRTVPRCLPAGTDVVILGGTGPDDVAAAAGAFLAAAQSARGEAVPRQWSVQPGSTEPDDAGPAPRPATCWQDDSLPAAFRAARLWEHLVAAADAYGQTGDEAWAESCVPALRAAPHLGRPPELDALPDVLAAWGSLEQSPALSDEDRGAFASFLWSIARAAAFGAASDAPVSSAAASYDEVVPWLALEAAGDYFARALAADTPQQARAATWSEQAGAALSDVGPRLRVESTDALWHGLSGLLALGLARPVSGANPSPQFAFAAACADNVGDPIRAGDPASPTWLSQRLRAALLLAPRVAAEAAGAQRGLQIIPVSEALWEGRRDYWREHSEAAGLMGLRDVLMRRGDAFDKLAFRAGDQPEDQYLLLDGLSGLDRGHLDANTILAFAEQGERLLGSAPGRGRSPFYHQGVTVARGVTADSRPFAARLHETADLESFGYSHTSLDRVNGVDWRRHVVWVRGRLFVVIDEIECRDAGYYTLTCNWRSPLPAKVEDRTWRARGRRAALVLTNADGARLISQPDPDQPDTWLLRQIRRARLGVGDIERFINVIHASPAAKPRELAVRRVSATAVEVTPAGGESPMLVGIGDQTLKSDNWVVRVSAGAFYVDKTRVALMRGRNLNFTGFDVLKTQRPVTMELNLRAGTGISDLERPTIVWLMPKLATEFKIDGQQVEWDIRRALAQFRVPEGRHRLTCTKTDELGLLFRLKWEAADGSGEVIPERPLDLRPGLQAAEWRAESGALRAAAVARDRDGSFLAMATDEGLAAVSASGERLWESPAEDINSVAALDLNGDGADEVLIGGVDGSVVALDGAGEALWQRDICPELSGTVVALAAHAGQETPRLLALTRHGLATWLAPDGGPTAHSYLGHRAGTALCALGDSLIAVGAETGGPRFLTPDTDAARLPGDRTPGRELALVALPAEDGSPAILVCGGDVGVYAYDSSGALLWHLRTELPVRHVQPLDLDGDGSPEIVASCESGHVFATDAAGTLLWESDLAAAPVSLAIGEALGDEKPEIMAWCADGMLHALDLTGRRLAALIIPGTPHTLLPWPGPEARFVAVTAEGSVYAIKPE